MLDVCDAQSVAAAFQAVAPSVVIHCAAYGVNYTDQDFGRALEVNVHGALRVLSAAARSGIQRFVHVGSAVEYGSHDGAIGEDAALNPTAIYGATKAAATILLRERAKALEVPLLVVRPFGIWGPGEGMDHLTPQIITACMQRMPLRLTSCEVLRDYSYVEDMADDILSLALTHLDVDGMVVNLGAGRGVVLRDFVLSIASALGGADLMQFGSLPYRPTEMRSLVADTTRARQLLGRRESTPVAEGVRRMVIPMSCPTRAATPRHIS
jgi:nucleoside-diphosphate-sugar epimerase